ncbi:MACPF domain-containing protein CAD1-like [Humulus lupulus]|uniref:MACPF domain-containing protein CAD1-like n=1 Tax=Humulus lupulus TaxID=3486 RepID=UPI002B415A2F|nr:MACPF domain-containing protein CAD1-like [Humulus lupulus]
MKKLGLITLSQNLILKPKIPKQFLSASIAASLPFFLALSADIDCSPCKRTTEKVPVCNFHEMAEYFNKKSDISGNIPLGSFNSMFNFTGSWQVDAVTTKSLAMVGYIIPLFTVKLEKPNLILHEEVKRAIPYSWDPASLASLRALKNSGVCCSIEKWGCDPSNSLCTFCTLRFRLDIENCVKYMGDHRFQDSNSQSTAGPLKYKDKDVTVIFRRRGGDDLEQSHSKWAETVGLAPDVINMTFTPIVSLLEGVPGIKHLARAIELYLEFKPPIEDLQYFLDFQIARVWAPEQNNLQRKEPVGSSLQFSLMGPKLYISPDQVLLTLIKEIIFPISLEQRAFFFM